MCDGDLSDPLCHKFNLVVKLEMVPPQDETLLDRQKNQPFTSERRDYSIRQITMTTTKHNNDKTAADSDLSMSAGSICNWCDELIEAGQPSVPDVNGEEGGRQHLGCSVEEADDIGFDGFIQDQG
jgi:hypothetical protein